MEWFQQGDVLVKPAGVKPQGKKVAGGVLRLGEATGHKHVARGRGVAVLDAPDGTRYLHAPKGARITHEEHKPIDVPPGDYTITGVREYDHFAEEAREVVD